MESDTPQLSQEARGFAEMMAVQIVALAQQMASRMTLQAMALAEKKMLQSEKKSEND